MKINSFEWDEANIIHIEERHGITPEEAEEVFFNRPLFRKTHSGRFIAYGQTDEGKYLSVIFLYKPNGVVRVITARDMDSKECRYYIKERRG